MGAALGKTWKGVSYGQNGEVESCVFCKICEGIDRKTEVAYEDQRVIVFKPLARCAAQHWLVVPRQHIQNVKALNAQDIPILSYMREIGEKVLKEKSPNPDPSNQQYVFHVPPVNSIDHLHLHCQVLPFRGWVMAKKYQIDTIWCSSYDVVKKRIEEKGRFP